MSSKKLEKIRQSDTTVKVEIMASFSETPATTEPAVELAKPTEPAQTPSGTADGDEGDEGP